MDTASKVLVVGGVLNIAIAFVLGNVLAGRRRKAAIEPLRFLLVAHEAAIMQGSMLLALTLALALSNLSTGWETTAAWLMVAASAFNLSGNVANWTKGITDQFVERSLGLRFNTFNAILAVAGMAIIVVGVFKGL